jgi:hypothetical protein
MSTSDVPADDGSNAAPSPEQPTCAVCLEQLDPPSRGADGERAAMPCCDRDGATMAFCVGCVDIICSQVRSIQKFFTHLPVSMFDRVPFQLTGELFLYGMALRAQAASAGAPSAERSFAARTTARAGCSWAPSFKARAGCACSRGRSWTSRGTCATRASSAPGTRCGTSAERARCVRRDCPPPRVPPRHHHPTAHEPPRHLIASYPIQSSQATQRIPHPMWRYQPSAATFGNVTWACQRCGDYTNWRVHPDDADGVPLGDAPESWGVRERWLEDVRRTRNEGRGRREEDAGGFVDGAHGYGGWNVRMRRANGGAQFRFQLNCAIS